MNARSDGEWSDGAWSDGLVTAAVLGTDRRDPPVPPAGPLGDLVRDALVRDPAESVLVQLAVVGAARAAAGTAGPPTDPPPPPVPDDRPWCPPASVATFHTIDETYPVLVGDWVRTVVASGHRLPADVAVTLLRRTRSDPERRRWVEDATGPLADWIGDLVPALTATRPRSGAGASRSRPGVRVDVPDALVELVDSAGRAGTDPADAASRVVATVLDATHRAAPSGRRPVLERVLAAVDPGVLDEVAAGLRRSLDRGEVPFGWSASVEHLLGLVEIRRRLRRELRSDTSPGPGTGVGPPR